MASAVSNLEMTLGIDVMQILQRGRGPSTDFLLERAPLRLLAETMAAMANSDGGTILLGVSAVDAQVRGLHDIAEARDRVLKAALLCEPPLIIPLPKVVSLDKVQVLLTEIPPGLPHVYSVKGKYLTRVGVRNQPLSPRALRLLLLERGETSFEARQVRGATIDDLDPQKVNRYLQAVPALATLPVEEALLKRGCLSGRHKKRPTVAGILLFAKDVEHFFRHNEVIVVRYAGNEMNDEFVREDIIDTLPEQIRRAESAVLANLRTGVQLTSLQREERFEYPLKAVREAIVNAVAHRDYSLRGDNIRISIFSDRIEFYSPGRLPGHVTVENIVEERFSRNEVIVQVLSDMGFIERLGYGIDRMIKLMAEAGLPLPQFQETANGFMVTLYGPGEDFVSEQRVKRRQWRLMGLNERQMKALEYLSKHERITNREYQSLCPEVSAETIRRDLADLVARDILLKIGDKRATYYIFK